MVYDPEIRIVCADGGDEIAAYTPASPACRRVNGYTSRYATADRSQRDRILHVKISVLCGKLLDRMYSHFSRLSNQDVCWGALEIVMMPETT